MKPNNDIENNIEASMKLLDDIKDKKNVETILIKAKIIKNNFFLLNLSANNPNNGAEIINNRLATELDIPRYRVLADDSTEGAKNSA